VSGAVQGGDAPLWHQRLSCDGVVEGHAAVMLPPTTELLLPVALTEPLLTMSPVSVNELFPLSATVLLPVGQPAVPRATTAGTLATFDVTRAVAVAEIVAKVALPTTCIIVTGTPCEAVTWKVVVEAALATTIVRLWLEPVQEQVSVIGGAP
jgi:hypothetical protein